MSTQITAKVEERTHRLEQIACVTVDMIIDLDRRQNDMGNGLIGGHSLVAIAERQLDQLLVAILPRNSENSLLTFPWSIS